MNTLRRFLNVLWRKRPDAPPKQSAEKREKVQFCCYCAIELFPPLEICPVHLHEYGQSDTWAAENRIYCAFIHDSKDMPRLPREERDTDADEFRERYHEEGFLTEEDPVIEERRR